MGGEQHLEETRLGERNRNSTFCTQAFGMEKNAKQERHPFLYDYVRWGKAKGKRNAIR